MDDYHANPPFVNRDPFKHNSNIIGRARDRHREPVYSEQLGNWQTIGVAARKVLARSLGGKP
jgi:hypothetical protein